MPHTYQAPTDLLSNSTILVTGAGDGIGKAAAKQFAKHGATVLLLGKTVSKLERTYDEILADGSPEPAIIPMDLAGATESNFIDLAHTIEQQFGQLNGLLHNAGLLGDVAPLEHQRVDVWEAVFRVNVTAAMLLNKALLPLMKRSAPASIIFTSSGVGRKGRAYWGAYAASKFATEGMMQTLADELDPAKVRVNAINPGATRTQMRAKAYPAEDPAQLKTAEQIMPLYLYLMGKDSLDQHGQSFDAQPR